MKKTLLILLSVVTIITAAIVGTQTAAAATSGTTGNCTWSLSGTELTISGNGVMGNYSYYSSLPWGEINNISCN